MLGVVFFRNLVMDLVAMDVIFKLATSHKLDVCMYCYLFQVISGFKIPSDGYGLDGQTFQTGNIVQLAVIILLQAISDFKNS